MEVTVRIGKKTIFAEEIDTRNNNYNAAINNVISDYVKSMSIRSTADVSIKVRIDRVAKVAEYIRPDKYTIFKNDAMNDNPEAKLIVRVNYRAEGSNKYETLYINKDVPIHTHRDDIGKLISAPIRNFLSNCNDGDCVYVDIVKGCIEANAIVGVVLESQVYYPRHIVELYDEEHNL